MGSVSALRVRAVAVKHGETHAVSADTICPPVFPPQKGYHQVSLTKTCDIRTKVKFILVFVRCRQWQRDAKTDFLRVVIHQLDLSLHSTNTISIHTQPCNPLAFYRPFSLVASPKSVKNHFFSVCGNRFAAINHIDINRGSSESELRIQMLPDSAP